MPRPKRYATDAERMKAYRERKRNLGKDSAGVVQNQERGKEHPETIGVMTDSPVQSLSNLPVPVLADAAGAMHAALSASGEALESTTPLECRPAAKQDSCGGQTLSRTDQKFNEDRPDWYIFGETVKERNCWKCGKRFETRLEMNKFCSPRCKNEYLDTAFTKMRSPLNGGTGDCTD